jgi:hypothetical protein
MATAKATFVISCPLKLEHSPGPDCAIDYTPKDGGKLALTLRNLGPGENKSTLKVEVEK